MTNTQDASVGFGLESTYKTGVTPTRWVEFSSETLDWKKAIKQGTGLRVGGRVDRSARRVVASADGGGDLQLDVTSKGLGLLFQACLGTGVSTAVTAPTYQQMFTLGDQPPSLTVQKGVVEANSGTIDPITFLGCMVTMWELDCAQSDLLKMKVTLDAGDITTSTAYAAPSYASGANLFSYLGGSISTGTLTPPTNTTLATATTPVANIRAATVKVDRGLNTSRYVFGGGGRKLQPTTGAKNTGITGSFDIDYVGTTFRDALLNDTPMSVVMNFTAGALSVGLETVQIVLPDVRFDTELVKISGGDLPVQKMAFTALDNLTATQPIWVIVRTSDTAL